MVKSILSRSFASSGPKKRSFLSPNNKREVARDSLRSLRDRDSFAKKTEAEDSNQKSLKSSKTKNEQTEPDLVPVPENNQKSTPLRKSMHVESIENDEMSESERSFIESCWNVISVKKNTLKLRKSQRERRRKIIIEKIDLNYTVVIFSKGNSYTEEDDEEEEEHNLEQDEYEEYLGESINSESFSNYYNNSSNSQNLGSSHSLHSSQKTTDRLSQSGEDLSSSNHLDARRSSTLSNGFVGWVEKYRISVKNVDILTRNNHAITVKIPLNKKAPPETRVFEFADENEAISFSRALKYLRNKSESRIAKAIADNDADYLDKLQLLIEVVSASNLPATDNDDSSDPYVVVSMNNSVIHRTKFVQKSLFPIWTVKTGAFFIFESSPEKFFSATGGMKFEVYDYDTLTSHDKIGHVYISPQLLCGGNGERNEFELNLEPAFEDASPAHLALRFRRATDNDKDFLKQVERGDIIASNRKDQLNKEPSSKKRTIVENGVTKFKVKPGPDPARVEETTYLSKEEIKREVLEESHGWVEAGTGDIGKVYLEILACDDLPNLDVGSSVNVTDSFVTAVYEDTLVFTDVIWNALSPRWLPWTKRAFMFHMAHSSSNIFIGVFDYDNNNIKAKNFEFIGRVSINTTNFIPNTEYTLKYNLYQSEDNLEPQGKITVRVRVEYYNERQVLLSNLAPSPTFKYYAHSKLLLKSVRNIVYGARNMDQVSAENIKANIDEISSYLKLIPHIKHKIKCLLFWRNSHSFAIGLPINEEDTEDPYQFVISLPLNSICLFFFGINLVEKPNLIPSFVFASIAWFMLFMSPGRTHPSPWLQCKSFNELMQTLLFGKSPIQPQFIQVNDNFEEVESWREQTNELVTGIEDLDLKKRQRREKILEHQMTVIGDADEAANREADTVVDGSLMPGPLKAILSPVQKSTTFITQILRVFTFILTWEESYYSFWITFFSFCLAIANLFIPWGFICKWAPRVFVWTLFGPWMKLLDLKPTVTSVDKGVAEFQKLSLVARGRSMVKKELKTKNTAMKRRLFGKFITTIPTLKCDRFRDIPLDESFARPIPEHEPPIVIEKIPGQHLSGNMIPDLDAVQISKTETAPISKRQLLNRRSSWLAENKERNDLIKKESKAAPILVSGVITWYSLSTIIAMFRNSQ